MKKLDFIVAGSQKAGTTSLHQFFSDLGVVDLPREKETNFWDFRYSPDIEKYWELFNERSDANSVCGEVSPHYWLSEKAGKRLSEKFPELKVIMVVRNPLDRAYSAFNMYKKLERYSEYTSQDFQATLDLEKKGVLRPNLLANGDYNKRLPSFLLHFEASNVLIVRFENLVRNQSETLKEILTFLDLNDSMESYSLSRENHSGIPRNRLSYFLFNVLGESKALRALAGRNVIAKLKRVFFQKPDAILEAEKDSLIQTYFQDHFLELEEREESLMFREYRVI